MRQWIEGTPVLSEVQTALRLLRLPREYVRAQLPTAEARCVLEQRLERRATDFLELAREAIYDQPVSPYRDLLHAAGCELGDLERLVEQEGLEGALGVLFQQGVYLTLDELKGRRPAVRGSLTIEVGQGRLRNPALRGYATIRRGGSRGAQTTVPLTVATERERAINRQLIIDARGEGAWEQALWNVPGGSGISAPLRLMIHGIRLARWFTHVDYYDRGLHPRYRWSMRLVRLGALLAGYRATVPQYVPITAPLLIARWMADVLRRGGTPQLLTYPSPAVRLCQAAMAAGIDLHGAWFSLGGEPMTAARRATIEASGARAMTSYSASEAGNLGRGCLAPAAPDDTHFFHDLHAAIQPGAHGPARGLPPRALLLTSLRRGARFILLNTSLGDQAEMGPRACGCPLERLGWPTHLAHIRSFEKLTAGGMTFHDVEVIRVLEEVLPARFGGGPTDYQLVDDEAEDGRPCVRLLVHPRLGALDTDAVRTAFFDAVGAGDGVDRIMALSWRTGELLTVERTPPHVTASGKIHHVHLARRGAGREADDAGE